MKAMASISSRTAAGGASSRLGSLCLRAEARQGQHSRMGQGWGGTVVETQVCCVGDRGEAQARRGNIGQSLNAYLNGLGLGTAIDLRLRCAIEI